MSLEFKKILVTAEKANSFPAACDFADFVIGVAKPTEVDFLFINDDLSSYDNKLKAIVRNCISEIEAKGISTEHNFRGGNFHRGTVNMTEQFGHDLIICGSEMVTGFRRFWNGSETYKLIKTAPCFVVSVQVPMKRKEIKKIILPIDSSPETCRKVPIAAEVASFFGAEIYLAGVSTSRSGETLTAMNNNMNNAKKMLHKLNVEAISKHLQGTNLTDMTLQYAEDADADFIMMMAVEEPNPYGMFEGSYPEQMVLKSQIPLMAINMNL